MKKKPSITITLIILTSLLLASCQAATTAPEPTSLPEATPEPTLSNLPELTPDCSFPRSTPEEQGMDSQILLDMLKFLESGERNIHSFLVLRNGKLVMEVNYPPFNAQDKHLLFSATKSVVSALVGIAIQEGKIERVDLPVLDFFPNISIENLDERKKNIHIHDLLNMTSGLSADDDRMEESLDWSAFTLNQPMATEPGLQMDYNSGNSQLLSAIIQKTTGKTTFEYAREKLFKPLHIHNAYWAADPSGVSQGGLGLMLTPIDMAKFGFLYLNQGQWQGEQIVPAEWIAASTRTNENGYAYQWWHTEIGYTAVGVGGQYIYIYPEKDIVVVTTASVPVLYPSEWIEAFIPQAVKSDQPLPESPAAQELADWIEAISHPQAKVVAELPAMAAAIGGRTLQLDENALGWTSARLDFEGDQAWLTVTTTTSPEEQKFAIGLDDVYRTTAVKKVEQLGVAEPEQRVFLNPFEFNFLLGLPLDGAVAMKGEWTRENTFSVTVQDKRDYDREEIAFRFIPPIFEINWQSEQAGGSVFRVEGKIGEE